MDETEIKPYHCCWLKSHDREKLRHVQVRQMHRVNEIRVSAAFSGWWSSMILALFFLFRSSFWFTVSLACDKKIIKSGLQDSSRLAIFTNLINIFTVVRDDVEPLKGDWMSL